MGSYKSSKVHVQIRAACALQALASPKLETPLSMRTPGSKLLFSLSQFATPPTALPARHSFGSMADAQAHVEVGISWKCSVHGSLVRPLLQSHGVFHACCMHAQQCMASMLSVDCSRMLDLAPNLVPKILCA